MYKAILNNKEIRKVRPVNENKFVIDDKEYVVERYSEGDKLITVKNGIVHYKIKILRVDTKTKTFQLEINSVKHKVLIHDKFDLLLEELGYNSRDTSTLNQIKAPMPGLILEVNVTAGDEVSAGDKILVLEAMKMENVIKSPGDGKVKEIKVMKGDSVEKNQVMIQF